MYRALSSRINRLFAAFRPPDRNQVAALCWRKGRKGTEVLLITTRGTGRWTPPKGHLMDGKTPAEAAAIEAWEEAGLSGQIAQDSIGAYEYMKFYGGGRWERMSVNVYPLRVEAMNGDYPEKGERKRQWFSLEKASSQVDEPTLRKLIRAFTPPS